MSLIPTKEATQQREHEVWQLRVRCYSQEQIAAELGISQGAVSQILKRVRARLAREFAQGAVNMRLEQTEQLMAIAREALAAWEESKHQPPAPCPPDTKETPAPLPTPQPEVEQPSDQQPAQPAEAPPPPRQPGKPAYLRAALQSLAAIRALWNMEKIVPSETDEPVEHYKIILGLDYDHLFTKDGVHVPREKIAHQIPEDE